MYVVDSWVGADCGVTMALAKFQVTVIRISFYVVGRQLVDLTVA